MNDIPRYQYQCSVGHEIGSNVVLDSCPAYVLGEPCPGTLRRFGPGSQGPRRTELVEASS